MAPFVFVGVVFLAFIVNRFAPEVKPIWEQAFKNRTREELIALIHSIGGDAVPILDYPSLLVHPQVEALGAIAQIQHSTAGLFQTVAPFIRFSETPLEIRSAPPTLGQHTCEIMSALGLSGIEIERLRDQNLAQRKILGR